MSWFELCQKFETAMARLVIDRNGKEERRNTRKVEIVFEEKRKIYFKEGIFGMDSFIF